MIAAGTGFQMYTIKDIVDDDGRAAWGSNNIFFTFQSLWGLYNLTNMTNEDPGKMDEWIGGSYNTLFISNKGGKVDGGEPGEV